MKLRKFTVLSDVNFLYRETGEYFLRKDLEVSQIVHIFAASNLKSNETNDY